MVEDSRIKENIDGLVQQYFASRKPAPFIPGKTRIPLNIPSFGYEEVNEAIDSLLTTRVTMGEKVKQFERLFADYIGVKYAVMVNSGSSANLLALSILTNPGIENSIRPGDEIITPAVTWATTVFPIINCGAVPVLVDIDPDNFNISLEGIRKAITDKTRAIMPVHLLGNPCSMDGLMKIAREHNLFVIEDACEAHGAEFKGQKAGSFGDMSTFSFFFSRHITTIEGGMVLTDNEEYAELAKALRAHGWIRDLKAKNVLARKYGDIDPRFLFTNIGYNFRPMEIQGGFGIHQMKKLERFIDIRRDNAAFWHEKLKPYSNYFSLHEERADTRHVWFGYPLTVSPKAPFTRQELVDFLESKQVETRPIMAGNIDEQPVMRLFNYRKVGNLPNSRLVMRNAFFFGNHQGIGKKERTAIVSYIEEFMAGR
ncbi:MAG: aminotransferase class I/II-fold pyridoxal phosphate-dependent enzyme [Dehalococcoidales bacterium]|nr:aminotransferase class I/II-fold pyridoxal phosphate-dependent enzyme [Dehalococcoidales bacterium]